MKYWSSCPESNWKPSAYKAGALPIELQERQGGKNQCILFGEEKKRNTHLETGSKHNSPQSENPYKNVIF